MEEVFGAAERQVFDLDFCRVGLLGWPKGESRIVRGVRRRWTSGPKVQAGHNDEKRSRGDEQSKIRSARPLRVRLRKSNWRLLHELTAIGESRGLARPHESV